MRLSQSSQSSELCGLILSHMTVESCEVAIAEQGYQQKVVIPLCRDWVWMRQKNIVGKVKNCPVRIGYTWRNWGYFCRNAWYWDRAHVCSWAGVGVND